MYPPFNAIYLLHRGF